MVQEVVEKQTIMADYLVRPENITKLHLALLEQAVVQGLLSRGKVIGAEGVKAVHEQVNDPLIFPR